jgi:CHAD domain-containing protein
MLLAGLADTGSGKALTSQAAGAAAISSLARQDAQLRRAGRRFEDLDARGRHELRGRIKTLRYGAEAIGFLATTPQAYAEDLTTLQDILGAWNDLVVGARLIRHLSLETSPPSGRVDRQARARLRKQFADIWAHFEAIPSPWPNSSRPVG